MSEPPSSLQDALSDRYRVERELGEGGMATVYLAHDLKHDRKVAIKVLKPELAALLGAERFVKEIRMTAALQHPHILPLFDSGNAGGFLFYVMPYVEGESLRAKLERETQLGISDAIVIACEVADALDYAHRHGVIHRDIKPENILLHDGRPIVADFGIALAVSAAAGGRMTESGFTLGTPKYMSPEQATAEKELTSRSDIYSLGCVLYEMLTGTPPHTGATAQQIIMKVVTEEVTSVAKLRKAVPPNVSAAVAQALEKIPADRFESAKAFADALSNPTYSTLHSVVGSVAVRERRWSRDPRSIGVASVAAIASVALIWALTRPGSEGAPTEYAIGLDSTAMTTEQGVGFAVAPHGDFVVYQASGRGAGGLWYLSLRSGTARRIDGTEHGMQPAISPDGSNVAFLRLLAGQEWTLEWVPIKGGTPVAIGGGVGDAYLSWLNGTTVQVVLADSNEVRSFDVAGGPAIKKKIRHCPLAFPIPEGRLVCGGDASKQASVVVDSVTRVNLRTSTGDSIFGAHFRVVDGRFLVYLSIDGDLLAAPVDLKTYRVGRSVQLVHGVARRGDTGAGAYDLSASGALVYAQGANHSLGHLVAIGERSVDTLVGQAAFRLFSASPDGTRLAAVVTVTDGEEVRIYDLRKGESHVWIKSSDLTLPIWNAQGDRLIFGAFDTLFVGSPDEATPPKPMYSWPRPPIRVSEVFAWDADNRVIVQQWLGRRRILSLNLRTSPPETLEVVRRGSFPGLSPDGRWISYADSKALWIQSIPQSGRRYPVAWGDFASSQWLSPTELTMSVKDSGGTMAIDRVAIDFSGPAPTFARRRWLPMPEFVGTVGPTYTLMPDRRVLYLRGAPERPVQYLRIIPDWVSTMKRKVDEANPKPGRITGWIDRLRK